MKLSHINNNRPASGGFWARGLCLIYRRLSVGFNVITMIRANNARGEVSGGGPLSGAAGRDRNVARATLLNPILIFHGTVCPFRLPRRQNERFRNRPAIRVHANV